MKTYSSKSNARRAAKKEFGEDAIEGTDFAIIESEGEFSIQPIEATAAAMPEQQPKPERLHKSQIENPVKQVRAIADSMPGARRKDVVAACVAQGIAYFTARTQYQKWRQASREG
jgi:hypothetical protein